MVSVSENGWRLLQHFYTFIHFDDAKADLLFKRFVRDYVHYIGAAVLQIPLSSSSPSLTPPPQPTRSHLDVIFCKAAIIIKHLMHESEGEGIVLNTTLLLILV